jgi:GTP pyrophosphokinase
VLANVASAVSRFDGNNSKAEVATFAGGKARIGLELLIRDLRHLEEISKRIAALKEVLSVERV